MHTQIETAIHEIAQPFKDARLHVFDIQVLDAPGKTVRLSGRVLDADHLAALRDGLSQRFPTRQLDLTGVRVLRQPGNATVRVATNLTGLYSRPTFLMDLSSELLYGWELEVLEEHERWIYTRQKDGYLGWAYRPYCTSDPLPAVTHLVTAPTIEIRTEPGAGAPVVTRALSGTGVSLMEVRGGWALVAANQTGWVPQDCLLALQDRPVRSAERRAAVARFSQPMTGVPYLWGGCSGNGIDCSGFARLVHAWLGLDIPRDADMQAQAARRLEPPFRPGDLLFFAEGSNERITHVGISLGGWKMIHSSRSRNGVYVDDVENHPFLRSIFAWGGTFLD